MKSPNPSNIDQWLFHYFEGDLSANEEAMLESFLLDNPQFDTQFEAWGAARINRTELEFVNQGALLKPLVSPSVLNSLSVFTAVGINLVLAAFIIFGNTSYGVDPALEANQMKRELFSFEKLKSASIQLVNHLLTHVESNNSILDTDANPTSTSSNYLLESVASEKGSQYSNVFAGRNALNQQNTLLETVVRSDFESNILSDATRALAVEENSANVQIAANPQIAIQSPEQLNNVEPELSIEPEIEVVANNEPAQVEPAQVNSSELNPATGNTASNGGGGKSESEGRDKKPLIRSNRFKGGDLLLTNSRDVEYLVPGMTRNQVNFGHVASDFATSIYTNTYAQWPGQSAAVLSNQLGFDLYLPEAKSGIGVQLNYDRYGDGAINNFLFAATYSPKIFLTKNIVLEPALRFKMGGTGIDRTQLTPGSWIEFDRSNAFVYTNAQQNAQVNRSINQDFGLGLLLNTKWGFIGANADNLMGSKNQALHYGSANYENRAPVFFNAVLGTEYESRNKKLRWSGQLVYQNFGDLNKFWFGSRIKYNSLSLGASVSSVGEPMLSVGWMSRSFSLLYSTDYAYSQMSGNKHLSHQLSLRITLKESRLRKLMLN
jgi:type IX secretion system PorP/SprF family membrane protein